ncbi:unnamed protein product, partial [marine sediment metagenome]
LITECMKELDIDRKRFNPKAILNTISVAKEELIDHEKFAEMVSDFYKQVVSEVYKSNLIKFIINSKVLIIA